MHAISRRSKERWFSKKTLPWWKKLCKFGGLLAVIWEKFWAASSLPNYRNPMNAHVFCRSAGDARQRAKPTTTMASPLPAASVNQQQQTTEEQAQLRFQDNRFLTTLVLGRNRLVSLGSIFQVIIVEKKFTEILKIISLKNITRKISCFRMMERFSRITGAKLF